MSNTDITTAATTNSNTPEKPSVAATAVPSSEELPSQAALDDAAALPVFDSKGVSWPFGELYAEHSARTLVIFVRHFYCGMCQEFLNAMPSAGITPDSLAAASPPARLVIIGCGEPTLIDDYVKRIGCPFPVYADPTRRLYDTLGMITTLDMGETRPEYQHSTTFGVVAGSFIQALGAGLSSFTKAGKLSQVGGEFLFDGGRATWCHRMKNTRGHTELKKLKAVLDMP